MSLLAVIELGLLDILLTGRILTDIGMASARYLGPIRSLLEQERPDLMMLRDRAIIGMFAADGWGMLEEALREFRA